MPRSHRRLRRRPPAPDPRRLHRLIQRVPNTSVLGRGFSVPSGDSTVWSSHLSPNLGRTSPSILRI
jgi:hypothetical protein